MDCFLYPSPPIYSDLRRAPGTLAKGWRQGELAGANQHVQRVGKTGGKQQGKRRIGKESGR